MIAFQGFLISKDFNINVIVENHGSLSSNTELLMQVINNVNLKIVAHYLI